MRRNNWFFLAAVLLCCTDGKASIFDLSEFHTYGALATRSQNPLYLLFFTETMQKGAVSLKRNQWSVSFDTTFSNVIEIYPQTQGAGVDLDLEVWRTSLKASYGLTDNVNIGIEIPFLTISGGSLDEFVQNFHHFFGFPNGQRDSTPNFRLGYEVTYNGQSIYKPTPALFGLGDIILWHKWQFLHESTYWPTLSVKTSLKVPTGRVDQATGSGHPDLGASFFIEKSWWRFHSYTLLGVTVNGGMRELDPILGRASFMFGEAIEFNIFENLSLVTQVTGNTSIFKNTTERALTYPVIDLNVGFIGEVPLDGYLKKIWYEFAFSEDLLCFPPSTDFSIMFKVGFVF
jgi:hypothetical protein